MPVADSVHPTISIEVAYALPDRQSIVELTVASGCTARQAAMLSKLELRYDTLDVSKVTLGIFGIQVDDGKVLQDGDRVELYRPLLIDPMEQRRQRAAANPGKSPKKLKNEKRKI